MVDASPNVDSVPPEPSFEGDVAATDVVATGSVAASVDGEVKAPGSVADSVDNAKGPGSVAASVDGEVKAPGSVAASADNAKGPGSAAGSVKAPGSVVASVDNAKGSGSAAGSVDREVKAPGSVAASVDNAKGPGSVAASVDGEVKAPGSVATSADNAKGPGSAAGSVDGEVKAPGSVVASVDHVKGSGSAAGSVDREVKAPGSVATSVDNAKGPGSVAGSVDGEVKVPRSVAASADNAKGPGSVTDSVHGAVIAPAHTADSVDGVSKPLGSVEASVHEGPNALENFPGTAAVMPTEQYPSNDEIAPQLKETDKILSPPLTTAVTKTDNTLVEQQQNQPATKLSLKEPAEQRSEKAAAAEDNPVGPTEVRHPRTVPQGTRQQSALAKEELHGELPAAERGDSKPSSLPSPIKKKTSEALGKPPQAPRQPLTKTEVHLPPVRTNRPRQGKEDSECAVVVASDLPPGFFDACCAASVESGALLVWRHEENYDLSNGETSDGSSKMGWPRNSRARVLAHIKEINLQPLDILARLVSGELEECASLFSKRPCISEIECVCREQLPQCAVFTDKQQHFQGIKTVDLGPFAEQLSTRRGIIVSQKRNWAHALGAEYVPLFANAQDVGDDFNYRGNSAKEFQRWLRYILVVKA